jgi:hypothetical protein
MNGSGNLSLLKSELGEMASMMESKGHELHLMKQRQADYFKQKLSQI